MEHLSKFDNFLKLNENVNFEELARTIDYTMLSPTNTEDDIIGLCERATDKNYKTVCVLPKMVKVARKELDKLNSEKGSDVGITTVVSFPEGTNDLASKMFEAKKVIKDGADEVDMVLNYKYLIEKWDLEIDNSSLNSSSYYDSIGEHIKEVKSLSDLCHSEGKILKVIVESGLLNKDLTSVATFICIKGGADFIKTSTGMVDVGAELDKIKIFYNTIREHNSSMKIKASGGIRTINDINLFKPYTDRFGVGSGSVDNIFGEGDSIDSGY